MMRLVGDRYPVLKTLAFSLLLRSLAASALVLAAAAANAETSKVQIGSGTGIHYLPLYVMDSYHLLEKHAAALGAPGLKVTYTKISGGAALNDAVVSGAVDFAAAGVGPFAILWDKTKGNENVRALAAAGDVPLVLLTTEPRIKGVNDIKEDDKIAVPAVKSSMQAVLLEMWAAKERGAANYKSLDANTVSMPHSEAVLALLSKRGIIDLHFSVPPFTNRELADPSVHSVADSAAIVGGPMTLNLISVTKRFHDANPVICKAFLDALTEAMIIINSDKAAAARIYVENDISGGADISFVEHVLNDPALHFTVVPHGVLSFINFSYKIGIIKNNPANLKDLFFPEAPISEGN